MKKARLLIAFILLGIVNTSYGQEINPREVKKVMKQVADWQIAHYSDLFSGYKKPHHPLDWTNGGK